MKLLRDYLILLSPFLLLPIGLIMGFTTDKWKLEAAAKNQTMMIALLLDTSNSMDGLIDQAKSQLWKIVNEVAAAKSTDGKQPKIKIALYEYGNDGLPASEGHIRQVSALTEDLDVISEKLFSLRTNGGNEFCGYAIKAAVNQLEWSASNADLKMIFIAGNEDFKQGNVSYQLACDVAKKKGIIVNSIYCGDLKEGISLGWKHGAELAAGAFMNIDQNNRTAYVPTPYDEQIAALNDKLNATYVYYGASGEHRKEQQIIQDKNAASYGLANAAERIFCKSSNAYQNSNWDLVDAAKENEKIITEIKAKDLPDEMRTMSMEERKAYISQKSEERRKIQEEIQVLNKKRQNYIYKTPQGSSEKMLDASMMKAIKVQGRAKNLKWEDEPVETADNQPEQDIFMPQLSNIIFKSKDGGQTWQDISQGLPENLTTELQRDDFFVDGSGLHLRAYKDGIYHNKLNSTTPFWEKERSPHEQGSLAPSTVGMFAYSDNGQLLHKKNGTSVWSPMYNNFPAGMVRTVFETAGGTVFISRDNGLFKSANRGGTWKQVNAGSSVMKLAEQKGVLLATSQNGILRSVDDGENWDYVLDEGGVGIDVEPIKGGFAAIVANRQLLTRTVRASYDGGRTWQSIDAGLPASLSIASIIQVGNYFFCGHPAGIYRSSDKGKTWQLIFPSIDNRVFNLFVSGNVIYAIPLGGGC
jgi:photosystem II stability/assembly factor-like uncharacterized protein